MADDQYVVRLRPAPRIAEPGPSEAHAPEPAAVRSFRRRRRKLVVVTAALLALLLNRDTVEGWVLKAFDQAKVPVRALEADGELRKANEALVRTWSDRGTYDVPLEVLATDEPGVAWREIVRYEVCFAGTGAVISADAATGTRSILHLRGVDYGSTEGEPGCPASPADLRPWSRR